MPQNFSRLKLTRKLLINAGLLALLVLTISVTTWLYVSSEHTFYSGEYVFYQNRTAEVAIAFRESPVAALQQVLNSQKQEYNKFYTLPLLPFILTLGDSRFVYILSTALVYLLPFSLTIGAIATYLIPVYPRLVFWSTALLTLILPAIWAPILRGFPDTGAAFLIALAALVYLRDVNQYQSRLNSSQWLENAFFFVAPKGKRVELADPPLQQLTKVQRSPLVRMTLWQVVAIGFLLAAAAIFRRHFAYSALAFLGAIACQSLIIFAREVRLHRRKALLQLRRDAIKIGLIAATSFITIVAITGDFTRTVMTLNYPSLYAARSVSFSDILQYYADSYGWVTWMLVLLGFSAGLLTRFLTFPTAIFILLYGVFALIEQLIILRYDSIYYTLHVTPVVVLGLAAFLWTAWKGVGTPPLQGKLRLLILGTCCLYLLDNTVLGLTPLGTFNNFLRPLFSASYAPLVRTDSDEIVRLISYLRRLTPNGEPIHIASVSEILNRGLVRNADWALHRQSQITKNCDIPCGINVLAMSPADSSGVYPLEILLRSQYVVVAIPFQHNLRLEDQEVVKVVFDAFTQNWEIARDFRRLPEEFKLQKGVVVNIYQRIRPTSYETAVRSLYAMQYQMSDRPGAQSDWIALSQVSNYSILKNYDNTYQIMTNPSVTHPHKSTATSLLYLGELPSRVKIQATLDFQDKSCMGASLWFALVDKQGHVLSSRETVHSPEDASNFALLLEGKGAVYLQLDILSFDKNDGTTSCPIKINKLAFSNGKFKYPNQQPHPLPPPPSPHAERGFNCTLKINKQAVGWAPPT